MDPPVLNDYHRYLMQNFQDPPAYTAPQPKTASIAPPVSQGEEAAQARLPQVADAPTEDPSPDPQKWSPWDKALQGVFAGISAFDAYDTNRFLKRDPNHFEENPLLGNRPSAAKLAAATAVGQALAALAVDKMPAGWPRRLLQLGLIGTEGSVIASNHGWKGADRFWNGVTGH